MSARSGARALCKSTAFFFAVAVLAITVPPGAAQNACTKDEVFGGYAALVPNGYGDLFYKVDTIPNSFDASNTWYFPRYHNLGLVADGSGHFHGSTTPPNLENGSSDSTGVGYALGGVQYKWHNARWSPFARFLIGAASISPDCCHGNEWSFAVGGGGGLDLSVSPRISLRLAQVDYIYSSYSHVFPSTHSTTWNSVRLAAGVVFSLGNYCAAQPVACTIAADSPTEVLVGEPVKYSVAGSSFNPKHTLQYAWKSAGGKLTSTNTSATVIDTTGLAPGTYAVTATVSDPKMKSGGVATCPATFLVKPPTAIPPKATCSVNPTSLEVGQTSTITMNVTNPDGRPLTYAWKTTGGQLTPSGASATLTPSNNDAGTTITVTGTVNDDRNLSDSCDVHVPVHELPPPCVNPEPWKECRFVKNPKLPARVDNDCKDVLDKLALDIQGRPSGKLYVVGSASAADAAKHLNLATQRAEYAKYYLTTSGSTKIDTDRIETRVGGSSDNVVRFYYVPDGKLCAGHTELGEAVQATSVKGQPRGKLPQKKATAPTQ